MTKGIIIIISLIFGFTASAEMQYFHKSKHHHNAYQAVKSYPEIQLEVKKDKMDGFNLTFITRHFTFAHQRVNQRNGLNEGHAHIYINGKKIRQYSPYFLLSGELLIKGKNEIRVSLHANDHSYFVGHKKRIQQTITIKN
tara:strand:+ start:617 stop:1036 length:420 start_codon:yes stop_codon:yes gene_type:complete